MPFLCYSVNCRNLLCFTETFGVLLRDLNNNDILLRTQGPYRKTVVRSTREKNLPKGYGRNTGCLLYITVTSCGRKYDEFPLSIEM